jgi:hypothetical protein
MTATDASKIWRPTASLTSSEARTPAPEGEAWRTVPVEPTEAMIAAANALWGDGTGVNYVQLDPEDFYAAMLAASPVVPVVVSEEQRQRVAEIVEAAIERHAPTKGICHTLDDADAIMAALRPTDTGWRDIATAPRDGSKVLLADAEATPTVLIALWNGVAWDDGDYLLDGFTHWMPLPPAPTDTGRE